MSSLSIEAAVLIPILPTETPTKQALYESHAVDLGASLLFTVRSQKVEHHKGQISFPGGMRDATDTDLQHTALRETHEEVGIDHHQVLILGELPKVHTASSQFIVTPFVGMISSAPGFQIDHFVFNQDEIDEILLIPIHHVLNSNNMNMEYYHRPDGTKLHLPVYHFSGHRIWGATAVMLSQFLKVLK